MAHVIPTLRTTLHTTYTPPARLKSDLPASSVAPAKAVDFHSVLRSQASVLRAVGNRQSSFMGPTNKPQKLSTSFLRNQNSRATAEIPPAGGEGSTSLVSNAAASASSSVHSSSPVKVLNASSPQSQTVQAASPSTTDRTPAASPTFFDGTNIPIQNPFGPNPYLANPTQNIFSNDSTGKMVPQSLAAYNFPTQQTAQTVAQLFGGSVFTEAPDPGNPFTLNQPRYMVRLANGTEINPGIISHFYDTRSDTPFQLKQLVQDVLNGGTMCTLQPNNGGYGAT
jgi:hypothetical protein